MNVDWGEIAMYRRWIVFLWAAAIGWGMAIPTSAGSPGDADPDRPGRDQVNTMRLVGREGEPGEDVATEKAIVSPETEPDGELVDYKLVEPFEPSPGETACGSCAGDCFGGCQNTCCSNQGGWFVDGWIAQGFTGNPDNPRNNFNGPLTFNDRANEYQLNQIYVSFGRQVDKSVYRWGIGGQVDFLYGTDFFFTTALGLETHVDGSPRWNGEHGPRAGGATLYGLAMPQLYAEAFAPVGGGVTVKVGHFYSLLGYESVMAAENFHYSHSYARQYGLPFTHTGALAGYRVSPYLQIHGGITRGWDNWEDNNSELAFLGQVRWCSADGQNSLRFTLHSGNEDDLGLNTRTTYSLIASRRISCRLSYAVEHVGGTEDNGAIRNDAQVEADWFGVTNYLTYQVSCRTRLGVRFEWFRDDENARVLAIPLDGVTGGDYHALTLGASHRLQSMPCLEVRPELRYDWSDAAFPVLNVFGMHNNFTSNEQYTFAISAIARF